MMLLNISVRNKLIATLMLVCLGYAGFGLYAILNLNRMQVAAHKANRLAASSAEIQNLSIRLVKFEQQSSRPTATNIETINKERLFLTQQSILTDVLAATELDDTARERLQTNIAILPSYIDSLGQKIDAMATLGLTSDLGALGQLNLQAQRLAEQLAMLESFAAGFKDVRAQEKDFLAFSTEANAEGWQQALTQLQTTIEQIGFGDVFNAEIEQYRTHITPVVETALLIESLTATLDVQREQNAQALEATATYLHNHLLAKAEQEADATAKAAKQSLIIGGIVLVVVIGSILATVIRSLNTHLIRLLKALQAVSEGKLASAPGEALSIKNEFGQLLASSHTMTLSLRNLITQMVISNTALASTAHQLDDNSQTIVGGSQRILDRSNTLAAATEQISVTANSVEKMAQQVSRAAEDAHRTAQNGVDVVQTTIDSIKEVAALLQTTHQRVAALGERSKEIDSVIDLIVGVAEQTTLLALNAAIEAARAGEAGRGFAVVADEVKALAEQTVRATGDITFKIETIQHETKHVILSMQDCLAEVAEGQRQGAVAVTAIHHVESQTQAASQHAHEIRQAIREVALTTQQMAKDMDQIAHNLDDNHKATQQIQASSRDIHRHVGALTAQIHHFEL